MPAATRVADIITAAIPAATLTAAIQAETMPVNILEATPVATRITVIMKVATVREMIIAIITGAASKTAAIQPAVPTACRQFTAAILTADILQNLLCRVRMMPVHGKKTRIPGLKTEEKTIRGKKIHKERRLLRRIRII